LRAAGETETTQEDILDRLELDEGDRGFWLLTEEEIAAVIYFFFQQQYLSY
jgi:cell division septal protein FtsQ